MKWCNKHNYLCWEVKEIFDEGELDCDFNCGYCDEMTESNHY